MPVFLKTLAVFIFIMLLRCPVVAQQLSTRLASLSLNCTKENRLLKRTSKQRILSERKNTYLAAGVEYHRTTTMADAAFGTIEKQARMGVPVTAGYRVGNVRLEAGGFFGVNMTRPQQGFWFANPETSGCVVNRHITPTAAFLMGVGIDISKNATFNFRFTNFVNLPDNSVLGNIQIGWRWTW